jgi:hypothetical protein
MLLADPHLLEQALRQLCQCRQVHARHASGAHSGRCAARRARRLAASR